MRYLHKYFMMVGRIALASSIFLFASCDRGGDSADDDTLVEISDLETIAPEQPSEPSKPKLETSEEMWEYMKNSGHIEQYRAGIIPTMVEDVPEYASKLLLNEYAGFLIVDKATMKLYRYDKYGVLQESMGMACSKNYGTKHKRRDNRTPEGFFTIEGKYDSTEWLYTDDDGNTSDKKGQFGPRFLRLKIPVTSQIGIHGTCAPWSIGGRRSHGCIRVSNENILHLFDIVQTGWPVIVSPGRKDMAVNREEGCDVPSVSVMPGKRRARIPEETDMSTTHSSENSYPTDSVGSGEKPMESEKIDTKTETDSIF